ncbi:SpvB/TcaC N-terminal domain-containing protein [Pseudofrankia sp. BMG5.36]|uniref:SpvB/TcaC N-terminal domain-containing protein n=1 Tax=Pseudofrankia sp. BMG5.36 TaxID=1834512 RepID=UPI0008DA1506|nr:SpvB/TcaC N-terminal domain-containing protein [Pseudofrankia sp. BMG5.36]OHV58803.1 hypothetical protein BCD48_41880 [Pseudofrankia sp. BMG5.36]
MGSAGRQPIEGSRVLAVAMNGSAGEAASWPAPGSGSLADGRAVAGPGRTSGNSARGISGGAGTASGAGVAGGMGAAQTGGGGAAASPFSPPSVSLPRGGGAVRGIGEKFAANPVTGAGSLTIPLPASPARSGFGPLLALAYDSGAAHGPFGLGWSVGLPSITRRTDKGLPTYDDAGESDVFLLAGAEDLVPEPGVGGRPRRRSRTVGGTAYEVTRYRPRVEGLYARIERWTAAGSGRTHWRSISRDNVTTIYGRDGESQIADRPDEPDDPDPARRVFSWLICESFDALGNAVVYRYAAENDAGVDLTAAHERHRPRSAQTANRYLRSVRYGNKRSRRADPAPPRDADDGWHFELVFDYGDHAPTPVPGKDAEPGHAWPTAAPTPGRAWHCRNDPFSSYRAGFEVRTYRLCQRILMFHHFPGEPGVGSDCLVRSLTLSYRDDRGIDTDRRLGGPAGAFLESVTLTGHRRTGGAAPGGGPTAYASASMPPLELVYSTAQIGSQVRELDPDSVANLPVGLDAPPYRWVDLDGESISGVLGEQAGAWFYKPNLGDGRFGPVRALPSVPSTAGAPGTQLLDLAGDGQLDVVALAGPLPGFFERADPLTDPAGHPGAPDADPGWLPHRSFRSLPALDWDDPALRFVDLNGDGHADVLITGDDTWVWYPSLGEDGFGPGIRLPAARDETAGPRLVVADRRLAIHLADMSGDGLADLVRVRDGEVCYWPNLGHGRFGPPVVMDRSPVFDRGDQFDPARLRLADLDGTGPTDLVYLDAAGVDLYRNELGNGWSPPRRLAAFPPVDDVTSVSVVDLLGRGTACLVWSSPLPWAAGRQIRYVDLMGRKPNLLVGVRNNLGAETAIGYASSTRFYLADKAAGVPWVTRLPFPVHVVERVTTFDRVSRNRFVTRYAYHHGYFDGVEREFRGFGRVEQFDTEHLTALGDGQEPDPEPDGGAPDDGEAGGFPAGENEDPAASLPPVKTVSWFHTGAAAAGAGRLSALFAHEYYGAGSDGGAEAGAAAGWLLDDTPPPERRDGDGRLVPAADLAPLPPEAFREACRALKGRPLRQEVYALDGSDRNRHPYTVTEHSYTVEVLADPAGGRPGVFAVHPRETVTVSCERDPADPRVAHEVVLDVDPFGTVTHAVSLAYGRTAPDPALPARTQKTQATTLVTETRTAVTGLIFAEHDDQPGAAAAEPDAYRVPAPYDVVTYQLAGPGFDDAAPKITRVRLARLLAGNGGGLAAGVTRTLVGRSVTRFLADGLDGPLPWRAAGARGLTHETYRLALTTDLLTGPLGGRATTARLRDAGYVQLADAPAPPGQPAALPDAWWAPSGTVRYAPADVGDAAAAVLGYARAHFFVPRRFVDPFAAAAVAAHGPSTLWATDVRYDDYDLVPVRVVDPIGNVVSAGERTAAGALDGRPRVDYRTLAPTLVTDPNRNRTAVALDALGRVAATAVLGKKTGPDATGDDLAGAAATPDLATATVEAFWADPLGRAGPGPHPASARALLGDATTRFVYDLAAYQRTRDSDDIQPAGVATIARERHVADADLAAGEQSPLQISFSYSDGFGREIQRRLPAEPDPALAVPRPDRWVCSGWVVLNNKGLPVRQYEPAFRPSHRFQFGLRDGVSPILCYDPLGRAVATLHPDHTYSKVAFDAWSQRTWDAADTAALRPGQVSPDPGPVPAPDPDAATRGNPAEDPGVRGFVTRLGWGEHPPTWYQRRTTASAAERQTSFGDLADLEQRLAPKALAYAATPTAVQLDPLGRPVLTVVHNRVPDTSDPNWRDLRWDQLGWVDSFQRTHVELDIRGNQLRIDDCADRRADPPDENGDRVVVRYSYDLAGGRLAEHSLEAGSRWLLTDVAGKPVAVWESLDQGAQRLLVTDYDPLRRPTAVRLALPATAPNPVTVARTIYGENAPDPESANLRGQVWRAYDGAGRTEHTYDLKGNPISAARALAVDYRAVLDWATNPEPALEPETWTAVTAFDALDRPTRRTHPDGTVVALAYNEAGLLTRVHAHIPDDPPGLGTDTDLVTNLDYNARGQRTRIDYGNGVRTEYTYEPETFRLRTLKTIRPRPKFKADGPAPPDPDAPPGTPPDRRAEVQNLSYVYDPAGNLTHIADDAQPTVFRLNTQIRAAADYVYDATYRLIEATGREHLGLASAAAGHQPPTSWNDAPRVNLPAETDRQALGNYHERYTYDVAGNLTELDHRGTDPAHSGWRRTFAHRWPSQLEPNPTAEKPVQVFSNRLTATTVGPSNAPGTVETFDYDERGNMSLPWLTGFSWDYRDQLASSSQQRVTQLGARPRTTYYVYDGAGERVRKVTDDHTLAGDPVRPAAERVYLGDFELYRTFGADGNPTLVRSTVHILDGEQRVALIERRLAGQDAAAVDRVVVRYQHANHLGSATVELDQSGDLISYEEYYPYGCTALSFTRTGVLPKRYRYTTKERDEETGLTYHGARYYAPWLTRWTACDPRGPSDGLNVYGYVRCNPGILSDPSGTAGEYQWHLIQQTDLRFTLTATARGDGINQAIRNMSQNLANQWMYGKVQVGHVKPLVTTPAGESGPAFIQLQSENASQGATLDKAAGQAAAASGALKRVGRADMTATPGTKYGGPQIPEAYDGLSRAKSAPVLPSTPAGSGPPTSALPAAPTSEKPGPAQLRLGLFPSDDVDGPASGPKNTTGGTSSTPTMTSLSAARGSLATRISGAASGGMTRVLSGARSLGGTLKQGVKSMIPGSDVYDYVKYTVGGGSLAAGAQAMQVGVRMAASSAGTALRTAATVLTTTVEAGAAGTAAMTGAAVVAAAGSVALAGATVHAAATGQSTPVDVADRYWGTHFGDIYGWATGQYSGR